MVSHPETCSDPPIGSVRELRRDKLWYQSLGLGVSRKAYVRRFQIEYMIKKIEMRMYRKVLAHDVDVLVFCIDGSASESN